MALFPTAEAAAAAPPETWVVRKIADRRWAVELPDGARLATATTKREAERLTREGFYFDLYHQERRWREGEAIPGWKPYDPDREERLIHDRHLRQGA